MTDIIDRDHEAQRSAWAVGWFLSLLKARRKHDALEHDRAEAGLSALGVHVSFDEDAPGTPDKEREEGTRDE